MPRTEERTYMYLLSSITELPTMKSTDDVQKYNVITKQHKSYDGKSKKPVPQIFSSIDLRLAKDVPPEPEHAENQNGVSDMEVPDITASVGQSSQAKQSDYEAALKAL